MTTSLAGAIGEVPSPEPTHIPAVLPIPEYEEIQELHEARGQGNTREQTLTDYEFTKCPAYAITTPV